MRGGAGGGEEVWWVQKMGVVGLVNGSVQALLYTIFLVKYQVRPSENKDGR